MQSVALFLGVVGLACLVVAAILWLRVYALRDLRKINDLFRQDAEVIGEAALTYSVVGALVVFVAAAMWWTA
jgi:hypothetical protein